MPATLLLLVLGTLLLVGGGDVLVRGASTLARSLGVRPLVIGLTVVAFGTSAPELVVNLLSAFSGRGDLAFGNVVGSNLANLGLILGSATLVRPMVVESTVIIREIPMMLLATAAAMALAVVPDLSGFEGVLERADGLCLLLFFAVFLYGLVTEVVRGRSADPLAREVEASPLAHATPSRRVSLGMVALGLVGLVGGGHLLVQSASELARAIGISEAVIGLSVVAVGTSLPELVTSLVAALRGEADMAIGNVVGSNVFNLLFVLGTTTAITPIAVPPGGFVDLTAAAVLSVLLWPLAVTRRRLVRAEGALLLAAWLGYTIWRW